MGRLKNIGKQLLSGVVWLPKTLWHVLKLFFKGGRIRLRLDVGLMSEFYVAYRL